MMRREFRGSAERVGRWLGSFVSDKFGQYNNAKISAEKLARGFGLKGTEFRKFVNVYMLEWWRAIPDTSVAKFLSLSRQAWWRIY
jgi:hypothetical protein